MRYFDEKLDVLQQRLLEMAGLVEAAVHCSVRSVAERDEAQAQRVFQNEARINQMQIEIDGVATSLMALHQPMAQDLRFLTAAIKINSDLERMGDLAINIVERSMDLLRQAPIKPLIDIPHMADLTESMVRKSLNAFVKRDPDLARAVLLSDDEVDELKDAIYQELLELMEANPSTIHGAMDLIFVAHNLERIADHATNIAEDVLFFVKGIDVRHRTETLE